MLACGLAGQCLGAEPRIAASSAILVDAATGRCMYEKNADAKRAPASTTKIMTAILLIEHDKPDAIIAADKSVSETDGSSLYMKPGEQIRALDMLYGIMLRSANDGCVAVAKHIAGSEPAFVDLMNAKAAEIGATSTHFANSNGLTQNGHYSTARDLATITRYAITLPHFNEVVRTKFRRIERDPRNKDTVLKNHVKLLWKYAGADGVKTGYTVAAGQCLVGSATRAGWRLISVVLNSPDTIAETSALLDYGFGSYERRTLAAPGQYRAEVRVHGGESSSVEAVADEPLVAVVRRGSQAIEQIEPRAGSVVAPAPAGTVAGELVALEGDTIIARTPLKTVAAVADRKAAAPPGGNVWRWLTTALAIGVFLYASASSKAARVRRYRLKALLRGTHHPGPGNGERSGRR